MGSNHSSASPSATLKYQMKSKVSSKTVNNSINTILTRDRSLERSLSEEIDWFIEKSLSQCMVMLKEKYPTLNYCIIYIRDGEAYADDISNTEIPYILFEVEDGIVNAIDFVLEEE